ncbi:MAG: hypothetical protein H6Q17_1072 [Bacteroidetes bacterium]|nr:hypothetical protein [Bacteroidota bacterium]
MKKSDIFWQTYLNLEKEVIEVSKYIFFTDEVFVNGHGSIVAQPCITQLETFSPHIADLLVRCCVQIEALSKELYFDNGGTKARGDNSIFFDEDCLKLIDVKWQTHNKLVMVVAPFFNFTKNENRILKPLREAHKRKGTYWERAYQAVKHDRYSSLQKGNVKALIQALAALFLLNIYYRNDSWIIKYNDISKLDYSMGSAIFSVKSPEANQLWYGNNPTISESPYVATYKDDYYQKIEAMQREEEQVLENYWSKQPEVNEPAFITQLQKASEGGQRVMIIWELEKYRLNKKIPNTLSFEDRKSRLITSEEWNGWIHQHNKHLSEDELTEDNIQKEIDMVGTCWGMEIMKKYQKMEWFQIAMNSEICNIYIPRSPVPSDLQSDDGIE